MKISIFTPTHNAQYLSRLEASLKAQTCQDFEWIVVPNGKIKKAATTISQAKVIPYKGKTQNIGEIKSFCCSVASGEILVEVDHDDELTPHALQEIHEAFYDQNIDFVYSNTCEIDENGGPYKYDEWFGWKYRPFTWRGASLFETVAFPPDPASFSKIWYAPNHVRAWKKSFYDKIGGHNKALAVLDDHELMCRTYIQGNVKHIDKCLYVYYNHPQNTCKGSQNDFIQTETLNIHDRFIYPMVEKWCDLNNLRKIDLCGGFNSPEGYESVDLFNGDIITNLDDPWPFADNSIGVFRAHDALEHLKNPIHVMKEAYRCLAPKGWFLTFTPSTDGRGAFQDPTHISFWNSNSFWYYTKADTAQYIGSPVKFQLNRIKNFFPSDWHQIHNILYVKADLMKYAGRTPGGVEI